MEEVTVTPLEARKSEVAQYEANIAMYEAIKATLPDWETAPTHLLELRTSANKHEAASKVANLADVELLAKLWYSDDCSAAIRSEIVELAKAKAILSILDK